MAKHVVTFKMGMSLFWPIISAHCKTCGWSDVFYFYDNAKYEAHHHSDPATTTCERKP